METGMSTEEQLNARLLQIQKRLEWISDEEARSAWVKGVAAKGHFEAERDRLLDETDSILDRLRGLKDA